MEPSRRLVPTPKALARDDTEANLGDPHGVSSQSTILLYVSHYHAVSARLRFLAAVGPEGPRLCTSVPIPEEGSFRRANVPGVATDSTAALTSALEELAALVGVQPDALELVEGFALELETQGSVYGVFLTRSTEREPFPAPDGMRWIELPESIRLPRMQRNFMRAAYEHDHESTAGGSWMDV